MKRKEWFRRVRGPVVAFGSLALVGAALAIWTWTRPLNAERLPVYGTIPAFSLVERSERVITPSDLLGKVSVVDFFYTRCTETCPLQSAYLARLQTDLSSVPDALLVSITVDPDHDNPAVLTAYAARFHAHPRRWLFLTGPRAAIYRLAVEGFHLAAFTSSRTQPEASWARLGPPEAWAHEAAKSTIIQLVHASRFAVVDRQARIRSYVDSVDADVVEHLTKVVHQALAER